MVSSPTVLDSSCVLLVGTSEWLTQFKATLNTRTDATVKRVETKSEALEVFRRESTDCLITEYALAETTGLDLLTEIRTETTVFPVLVGTASGSEAIASEAIRAGVTDYVTQTDSVDQMVKELMDRTERAVRSAQRAATQRTRARQFDAIFSDSRTATWVLDPDGSLVRVNQTAREMIDDDIKTIIGEPFWTLPWWSQTDETSVEIHQIVENALDGAFGNVVVPQPPIAS